MNEGIIISMGNELKKLKLDLHTHIWEASSFEKPSVETAYKVINQCKKIGVTCCRTFSVVWRHQRGGRVHG